MAARVGETGDLVKVARVVGSRVLVLCAVVAKRCAVGAGGVVPASAAVNC